MISQLKRVVWKAGLLAMLLTLLGSTAALAVSGGLDSTFSGDGKKKTSFAAGWHERMYGLALQSDGKLVGVGVRYDPANIAATADFALARYNTNGSLDSSFSGDGKQTTDMGELDQAEDVAVQSDGKIVVVGSSCKLGPCNFALARYNTGGALDSTFNGTGKKVLDDGTGDNGSLGGIGIMSDGRIVAAGYVVNANGDYDFAVYRFNSNGGLDSSFNGTGKVKFGFGAGKYDRPYDLRLQSGKVVVLGQTCPYRWGGCDFAVARLTSSGALDSTFSGDGKQTTDFGANDGALGVALQSDGKIVAVGGKTTASNTSYFALARYKDNGTLDATFNGTGKRLVSVGTFAYAWDVLVQGNGKIVVAGLGFNGSNKDFALVRLNPGGSLDTTFSGDGKVAVNFGGTDDGLALVRQTDGKYVVGGDALGSDYDFALARILP